ncbi:MAG: MerR family transcriptional regulator [Actinomycetaceae bacterium]|nr:MerR family transcriptional regulator [Actinomycetaceae bacterium]MDU0970904.1 MerR family transcriptional regulator [Actinomycetaceae bacterium]
MADHTYSISEAAKQLGMAPSALRFYDHENLIPTLQRTAGGARRFSDDDIEWVRYIERLQKSGMPIREIKEYVSLYREGDSTIEERRRIVEARRAAVERQMEDLHTTLDYITYKCWFYKVAAESGTCETPRQMPFDELPPDIRRIKEACGIHRY